MAKESDSANGEILARVRADEVTWTCAHGDGTVEACFETPLAVAALLAAGVVFVNAPWYRSDLPESDRGVARLLVNSSDVFAWACAEAEDLPMAEIPRLYAAWRADRTWGTTAWCIALRRAPAQPPVAARMHAAGTWDPERLAREGTTYLDARLAELTPVAA